MPQIYISVSGRTVSIDIEDTDTVADALQKLALRKEIPIAMAQAGRLVFRSKMLRRDSVLVALGVDGGDALTLAPPAATDFVPQFAPSGGGSGGGSGAGAGAGSGGGLTSGAMSLGGPSALATMSIGSLGSYTSVPTPAIAPSVGFDAESTSLLNIRLQTYLGRPPQNTLVFISVGCTIMNGAGGAAAEKDAMDQQCPRGLLEYCEKRGLRLMVILVDPNFGSHRPHQVYDHDRGWQHWISLYGEKVRHYRRAGSAHTLSTYATDAPMHKLVDGELFAGVNPGMLQHVLRQAGGDLIIRRFSGDLLMESDLPRF